MRADRGSIRRLARRERLAGSLWPVPTLFAVGALIAATITIALDDSLNFHVSSDRFLVGDTNTALTLTSVVATGMLAFLGIVFATTLVAIQLAASQYSPRAVRVFIRSRLTKVALGIFIATFVFSLVTLIATRSASRSTSAFTPVLSTTGVAVLVVATLIAFLVFANGTARLLRVQYLIQRIADDARPDIVAAFPTSADVLDVAGPDVTLPAVTVTATAHGVVDAVDVGAVAMVAAQLDGWIEITTPVGSYVGVGTTIAHVHAATGTDDATAARVLDCLLLTNERTLLADPGFGIRQLVDIASRALSPAVNDPTTAVQVVDRLTELLLRIVDRPDPSGWYTDGSDRALVRVPLDSFEDLLTLAFAEVIRYGADSPQVVRRVRAALDQLELTGGDRHRSSIERMRSLLDAAVEELGPRSYRELSRIPDPRGLG